MTTDRRTFLQMLAAGAAGATVPESIARAMAIPANSRTGTIKDVEHIVILMQENRSFDHYFGTMKGVRGFGDPRAVKLPSGKSVFHQPAGAGELLPFRRPSPTSPSLSSRIWPITGATSTTPGTTASMTAGSRPRARARWPFDRKDLPFHYALADAFTICDAYHCSLLGPTDPNRYHLWTGWVGNDGKGGGPVLNNAEPAIAGRPIQRSCRRLESPGRSTRMPGLASMARTSTVIPAIPISAITATIRCSISSSTRTPSRATRCMTAPAPAPRSTRAARCSTR